MALHQVRAVIAGLQQLELPVPEQVTASLATTDALRAAHAQIVTTIKPAGPTLPAPGVHEAERRAMNALYAAAQKNKVDLDLVLSVSDDVDAAEQEVARAERALQLIDRLTGNAASNPHAANTETEGELVAASDTIFESMHERVQKMTREAVATAAPLGGSLPTDASFALTATPQALDAYRALQQAGDRYAQLRQVQRALLVLTEGEESLYYLWGYAEVSVGLANHNAVMPEAIDGFNRSGSGPTTTATPSTPDEKAQRLLVHATRYGNSVWVPTGDELRYTRDMATWEANNQLAVRPRKPAGVA